MITTILTQAFKYGVIFLYGSTGETLIEKSGHLNLGIPGIMCFGAVGGCVGAGIATNAGCASALVVFTSIIFAIIFGGAMGAVYGVFTITLRCNQNVTGLTITTFGAGVLGFWKAMVGKTGKEGFFSESTNFTKSLFGNVGDDWFSQIFLSHGVLVYLGIAIAIICAIVFKKTRTGLSLTAVGENPAAADAAGVNVTKYKYLSCIIGAAIAGIGGTFYILDCAYGSLETVVENFGWIAVSLVIFSLWRPGIAIFGSFIFGLLYILPNYITGVAPAEKEILSIIPYAVTALTLIIISFFNKRETQPPSSLGVPYFREER